jgi:hypothetical protein
MSPFAGLHLLFIAGTVFVGDAKKGCSVRTLIFKEEAQQNVICS